MVVQRVSTFNGLNNTLRDVGNIQQQLVDLQLQISSGKKSQNFQGLHGQVEQYSQLSSRIESATQYKESNALGIARLKTANQSLTSMIEIGDQMKVLLVQGANGTNANSLNFEQQMKDLLNSLGSQLNTNFEGRFLFGGTNTADAPVPNPLAEPLQSGVPDASYYVGAQENLSYRMDERLTYEVPVRADDPAFQKMIAAAHQAIEAFAQSDQEEMGRAIDLMNLGLKDLNKAQVAMNSTIVNVEKNNENLESLVLYWKGVSDTIVNTDLVEATAKISSYQAALQASFQVYSRLSQLRLSDYLK